MGEVIISGTGVSVSGLTGTANLLQSIYAKIKATSGLAALIGSGDDCRAFPFRARQDCIRPYLIFEALPGQMLHSMNIDDGPEESKVVFRCYDEDLSDAYALAEAVIAAFQDFAGVMGAGGIEIQRMFRNTGVVLDFDFEATADGLFMAMVDFDTWYTRS